MSSVELTDHTQDMGFARTSTTATVRVTRHGTGLCTTKDFQAALTRCVHSAFEVFVLQRMTNHDKQQCQVSYLLKTVYCRKIVKKGTTLPLFQSGTRIAVDHNPPQGKRLVPLVKKLLQLVATCCALTCPVGHVSTQQPLQHKDQLLRRLFLSSLVVTVSTPGCTSVFQFSVRLTP